MRGNEPCFLPPATFESLERPQRVLRDVMTEREVLGPIQPLSERKRKILRPHPAGRKLERSAERVAGADNGCRLPGNRGKERVVEETLLGPTVTHDLGHAGPL